MSKVKSIVARRTIAAAKNTGDAHKAGTEVSYRNGEYTISNADYLEKTTDQSKAEEIFIQVAKWS